jgi:hypothetical protein
MQALWEHPTRTAGRAGASWTTRQTLTDIAPLKCIIGIADFRFSFWVGFLLPFTDGNGAVLASGTAIIHAAPKLRPFNR